MNKKEYKIRRLAIENWLIDKTGSVSELSRQISKKFNLDSFDAARSILYRIRTGASSSDKLNSNIDCKVTAKSINIEQTDEFKQAAQRTFDSDKKVFLITYAQNHTPVHEKFLERLERYAQFKNASIHVIAGRYKNPTSVFTDRNFDNWDPILIKYLDANRHDIHPSCSILSDVKIQPTAAFPLRGFNGITGLSSCIIGHPRMHLKSLPVLNGYPSKLLLTTGAITLPNYTDSKSGKQGEFHHTFGFVIVELDDEICHIRQVTANNDGSFTDLYYKVDDNITLIDSCDVTTLGDLHLGYHCVTTITSVLNYLKKVKPKYTIVHDLFDGYSINHHEMKNPFIRLQREQNGTDNLQQEIDFMLRWIDEHRYLNLVIVRSNHDDFLDRWLINTDWHKSPHKFTYLKLANIIANGGAPKGLIPYLIDEKFDDVITLGVNDSFRVNEIEYGMHGDRGANGSRGSIFQFKDLNTKSNTGHAHSCARHDGHFQVGCLTINMPYVLGLSNWTRSIVVTHNDGKRQHIRFINGRFTTFNHNLNHE